MTTYGTCCIVRLLVKAEEPVRLDSLSLGLVFDLIYCAFF